MSRTKTEAVGRKALSLWQAPPDAGEPLLCIATTFTFDATCFETECLGRFLQMETHPQESDAVGYLIEREEKLASARVCVVVDRRHATAKESLRWDVLPVSVPGGVQHSKVAVLCWGDRLRVIVGSGNLTEAAYRKNLEVFGTIDIARCVEGDVGAVVAVLDFLEHVVDRAIGSDTRQGPKQRASESLRTIRRRIVKWPSVEGRTRRVAAVFGGVGKPVLDQLGQLWPMPGSPPRDTHVLSPFFDSESDAAPLIDSLVGVMAKRRPRELHFYVRSEGLPDDRLRVFAPRPLIDVAGELAECSVHSVNCQQDDESRFSHAKMLVLCNDAWEMTMIGSSNFTRAGLGAPNSPANFEANLVYTFRVEEAQCKQMQSVWPDTGDDDVDLSDGQVVCQPVFENEGEEAQVPALPAPFREALFDSGTDPRLILLLGDGLPEQWCVAANQGRQLLSSSSWSKQTGEQVIPWSETPPFVLDVTWTRDGNQYASGWLVNVIDPESLPPAEELRTLTLEELIEVLASTRPLHEAVTRVLRKRLGRNGRNVTDVQLDPHKRINTETFLLHRTKRVALALERLRERLERPVLTEDALAWRLRGPVGARALAEAFQRDGRTPAEKRFFLAELALTLSRVRAAQAALGGLPARVIRKQLRASIADVESRAIGTADGDSSVLDRYVSAAFEEARR